MVADLREFSARAELAVRDTTGLGHGLPVDDADVVDRPGWVKATAEGMELLAAPLTAKLSGVQAADKAELPGPGESPARRSASSSVPVRQGARPVRPAGSATPARTGAAAAGRAEHREGGARTRRRTRPTSGCGCACTRAPTGCSSPPCRGCATTSAPWSATSPTRPTLDPADDAAPARSMRSRVAIRRTVAGVLDRDHPVARAAGGVRPADGPDDAARGHADHVMDAVGPTVVPSVAAIRAAFSERRRRSKRPDRPAAARAARDGHEARPVRKGGAFVGRGRRAGRDGGVQHGLDVAGDTADPGRDRRPGCLGPPGARLSVEPMPATPRAAAPTRRLAGRAPAGRSATIIVACSGGADSLALADRLRWPALGRAGRRLVAATVDHGLQPGSAGQAAATAAMLAGHRLSPRSGAHGRGDRPGRHEAAARRARYGRWQLPSRCPPAAGAVLLGAHRSTTRPRRCCSGWPAGRDRARSPGCAPGARPGAGRCSACAGPTPRPPAGGRARRRGRTRTTPTRRSPGCGCAARCCRCWKRCSAAGSRPRWPGPPS